MSLQNKFTTFIKYVIIELVTNNNTDIRDYDRGIKSEKSTFTKELKKHNNNFELAIKSTAKLLAENEDIISQLEIMYPNKYTENVINNDKDCCAEDEECRADDEDSSCEDEDCSYNNKDDDCGAEDKDEREEVFNFIISCSGLYQVHNLHPDETSKMCNKLFTLLSQ